MGKNEFIPEWRESAPIPGTWRSIFKWGDPNGFKHPNHKLYKLMKEKFKMSDEDFKAKKMTGDDVVKLQNRPVLLDPAHLEKMKEFVGAENVSTTDYDRIKYSSGKTYEETMELRRGIVKEICDIVVHPRDKEDVKKIVAYCNDHKIPLYPFGGGSSVVFGLRPAKGGITIVMNTHMNKIIKVNEIDQTCTVQPGMWGPAYEKALNNSKKLYGTKHNFTCGHFPQSFEFSTVGGWIAALGSGQQSSYYGDAYNIVLEQEYVTPAGGTFNTTYFPGTANGPKLNDIMKGNEGTFGVMVECTMKIFRYTPENQRGLSYIFKTWEDAVNACREISQGEFGMPGVFRLSDQQETEVGLKLYGVDGTWIDKLITLRGYKNMERCLFLARTEGENKFSKNCKKQIKKICKKYGGMYLTGYPLKGWEEGRYADPYMREDLDDYGVMIDTMESGVTWSNIHRLHDNVLAVGRKRPNTIVQSHASHFYPQGTNLYFIFFGKIDDVKEYVEYQKTMLAAIPKNGGSLSHHHGTGRMISPWMEECYGKEQLNVLRALKRHFDPNNIMNPGATLGLDFDPSELKNEDWRIDWKNRK